MTNTLRCNPDDVEPITDPTTGIGILSVFPEAFGQDGHPFVMFVEDPPNRTRERHYHHGDVTYFYVRGEHHIEGEGVYRAGDVRWTRAGHAYGPETTGPEGGAWWIVSSQDPIPVDVPLSQITQESATASSNETGAARGALTRFAPPYDWPLIDATIRDAGVAILVDLVATSTIDRINDEFDTWLSENAGAGAATSGSEIYDMFLGHQTTRLHGIAVKAPTTIELLDHEDVRSWAQRMLAPIASTILLNAGEFIQIGSGESTQFLHRDSDSWPLPLTDDPLIVNAIIALDAFTLDNGATHIAPGSHRWNSTHAQPTQDDLGRAVMHAGDAVLFRGDLLHGGGANTTDKRRRALSLSFCAGWLRPVENSLLNLAPDTLKTLPRTVQEIVGLASYDGTSHRGGMLGLYENGNPSNVLQRWE